MFKIWLICYLLLILIIDFTNFVDEMPLIRKFAIKHPALSHPLRCSLCATWWMSVVFVLMTDITLWVLLAPWCTRFVKGVVDVIYDLYSRLINKIV